jgi:predicted RNA-binding Zn-ribbon protein involved in translation (DUF1610 family)
MTEETIVRENLMTQQYYTGYCGNNLPRNAWGGCDNPRTRFNGEQFVCPKCGWVSQYPADFIAKYKAKWNL